MLKKHMIVFLLIKCLDYNDLTIRHFPHPSVFIWLKELYNSMLVHGFVPESFGTNVIIPIVKNRNANCNDLTNYKPIFCGAKLCRIV